MWCKLCQKAKDDSELQPEYDWNCESCCARALAITEEHKDSIRTGELRKPYSDVLKVFFGPGHEREGWEAVKFWADRLQRHRDSL